MPLEFTTPINVPLLPDMQYGMGMVCMGSCFAEHIGGKLAEAKFNTLLNPFGIIYNPASLAGGLFRMVDGQPFARSDLRQHQGLWHSWTHHGRYAHPDSEQALAGMNKSLAEAHEALAKARRLILTWGTAHIYEWLETGEIVANCHKVPAQEFRKRRMEVDEVVEHTAQAIARLHACNPHLQTILTVSPVRHLRDGLLESQRSKAVLLLAAEELCASFPQVHYFPAYEIMMDELRDYRYYKRDWVHPNELAVDWIWEKFQSASMEAATQVRYQQIMALLRGFQHRALHPSSVPHQRFLRQHIQRARQAMRDWGVDFSQEIQQAEAGLHT